MRVCFIHISEGPKSVSKPGADYLLPIHFDWLLIDDGFIIGGETSTEAVVELPRSSMKASIASAVAAEVSALSGRSVSVDDLEPFTPWDW